MKAEPGPSGPTTKLAAFIRANTEPIIAEWETFARSLSAGSSMDIAGLRDHAKEILGVIARDLETPETVHQSVEKGKGNLDADTGSTPTAAQAHGAGRAGSGFTVEQMVAEFRALRASVIRLWTQDRQEMRSDDLHQMTRFNEAIDQAIAESLARYTSDIAQTKERFLAILGHDLRTPLGAIITATKFMLELDGLGEPYRTLVAGNARSAMRMNDMVEDLLDFARTRFGDSIPIYRASTDVGEVLRGVVTEVRVLHADCAINVASTGDLRGNWDSARLTQAFTNLVGNAVQHGGASPIAVGAHGDGDHVVVTVQNRGAIIPSDQLSQIFDAMTQGSEGRRDRRRLGLGLYIVDKIMEAHGGTVSVESNDVDGTTFSARLPRDGPGSPHT